VFQWLAETGGMSEAEMLKTFNCGIGMILVVAADQVTSVQETLAESGEMAVVLGNVTADGNMSYKGKLL
jgi:phosphoribosylformylglycinamidine cyclo-ligase